MVQSRSGEPLPKKGSTGSTSTSSTVTPAIDKSTKKRQRVEQFIIDIEVNLKERKTSLDAGYEKTDPISPRDFGGRG